MEDGERLPRVFTEQRLRAQNQRTQSFKQDAADRGLNLSAVINGDMINISVFIQVNARPCNLEQSSIKLMVIQLIPSAQNHWLELKL